MRLLERLLRNNYLDEYNQVMLIKSSMNTYRKNKFYIQNGRCYCWNIRKEYKTSHKNEVIS